MERYLEENFEVKSKNSSEEALQRWRNLCSVVKNPRRRFRHTANLPKREEAASMRKTNQEKLRIAVLVSTAAFQFIGGAPTQTPDVYVVPDDVKAAGFQICAKELGSIVEGHDIKKLNSHGGVNGVAEKLSASITNGLPFDETLLRKRQEIYGINEFAEAEARSFWVFVMESLQDMTLMILGICAFVSLIVGIAMEGWPKGAHDGLGIVASILLVVFVTATSDYRQSLQFRDLDKEKKKITIQVTRNGYRHKMSIYKLLPGDIIHLGIGDQVPADGLFVSGFSVLIDESSLTGESEPVLVSADNPFLLSGTKVQDGSSCETMGSATSICSDKTGTLTTNHMTVVKSCICMKVKEVNGPVEASSFCAELPDSAVKLLLQSIFNNTGGEVVTNKEGKREILGSPTETALLEFGLSLGGDFNAERQASNLIKVEPFNSTKKRMGVVLELPDGGLRAHSKGASEIVLAACDKVVNSNGEVVPLDEKSLNHLKVTIYEFASEALRTLCLAYMDMENGFSPDNPIPVVGYTCIGIVGIKDPVRPGVKESVAICRSAGITVRMVTGDNINTAKAIARECGILTDDGIAIEGPDFREKKLEELHEIIPKIQVMARSSPLDKHTLVRHLRTTFNEVVAVTGDGTNDAPALHEADIGLAMGIAGTEVAKESADVIILDDNFSTIVTVAKWGRSVYINIQKFVQFQLTVNIVALVVNFSSACLTGNAPLTAVQLLWVNMIMDTLGALALATEPPTDELMKRTPVGRHGNFISNVMWRNILGQSFYQFIVIWILQLKGSSIFGPEDSDSLTLNTIIFNSFVFCQIFNEISSRNMEEINVFKGILDNYVFVAVISCTILFQYIIVEYLGTFANTAPLSFSQWFFCIWIGFLGMPIAAILKLVPV
ncbi:Calcium-transporting ATPase 2, plasma membrane-type-like protein [Drosera capensis]